MAGGGDQQSLVWFDARHGEHGPPNFIPEQPTRAEACLEGLHSAGFLEVLPPPGPAGDSDLKAVHDAEYLRALKGYCERGGGLIDVNDWAGPATFEIATRAAGAACAAVDAAMDRGASSLCLIRPPGHHACRDRPMGYCFVNHAAVAAARGLASGARRVAIFDFDVHHGNGTQEIFYERSDVLFTSMHQWPWYPWDTGDLGETGTGGGEGLNLNLPMPSGSGDAIHLAAVHQIIVPVIEEFQPELLVVSAGFDCHERESRALSLQQVTTNGFRRMAVALRDVSARVCGGRIVFVLEGGYDLVALSESSAAVAGVIHGAVLDTESNLVRPSPDEDQVLGRFRNFHKRHWSCLG